MEAGDGVGGKPPSAEGKPESMEAKVGNPSICSKKSSEGATSEGLFAMSEEDSS